MGHLTKSSTCGFFIFLFSWIVFYILQSANGLGVELRLQDRVFVALKGENLNISFQLKKPPNCTEALKCFDPLHKLIYDADIRTIAENNIQGNFVLANTTLSGEYFCQYKTANVRWFLRVRDSGYKEEWSYSETEVVIVSIVTGLLLIFSVGGSIYVFRGNWNFAKECCTAQNKTHNSDVRQEENQLSGNNESVQSTSFYASLETRPRSVYDVLDHSACGSAAGGQQDQTKSKPPKKKETQNTVRENPQDEGTFECVYENF